MTQKRNPIAAILDATRASNGTPVPSAPDSAKPAKPSRLTGFTSKPPSGTKTPKGSKSQSHQKTLAKGDW